MTDPCAGHEAELVAVRSRRRALRAKRQAAKTVDLNRHSVGLEFARPRFPFFAFLADVEAAGTGLSA